MYKTAEFNHVAPIAPVQQAHDWETLYSQIATASDIRDVIGGADIETYRQSFFDYVEARDDKRAAELIALDNPRDYLENNAHARHMREFVMTEVRKLESIIDDRDDKGVFTFIGCGGASETVLHMAASAGLFRHHYGVDNRPEAVSNANTIFKKFGLKNCSAVFNTASQINPGEPKTVMLAAYLHPDRQTVFDRVCEQTKPDDIIILRQVVGGLRAFTTPVKWDEKTEVVGNCVYPHLGVETKFLKRIPS